MAARDGRRWRRWHREGGGACESRAGPLEVDWLGPHLVCCGPEGPASASKCRQIAGGGEQGREVKKGVMRKVHQGRHC